MGLNFKITLVRNPKLAEKLDLDPRAEYEVDTIDHEAYFIRHPRTDEKVEILYHQADEIRPPQ